MKHPEIPDELDAEKLAEVALGLLALTLHDGSRAWKGLDWDVMNLLLPSAGGFKIRMARRSAGLTLAETLLLKHFGHGP